jgi:hypothetical protein
MADRLGFDSDTARTILARAQRVQQIKEQRGKQSKRHRMECVVIDRVHPDIKQEIACPWFKEFKQDRKIIEDMELSLGQMATKHPANTGTVLGYYVNNLWSTGNMLPFRDPDTPDDAISYKAFLSDLGIPDMQMRFGFFSSRKRCKFRAKWKQALNLTWRHRNRIETCKPPFRANSASDRWCAIEPDFRGNGPGELSGVSNGFRFLMVMAAIRFGYDNQ